MSNDLIAAPEDQTQWYTGLGIAESIADIVSGVESENWVEAGIGIFATAAEAAAWATDPFGQIIQYGVSWLMEHLKPLRDALDWLAGDPPQIEAYAQTWRNVSQFVGTTATSLLDRSRGETAGWQGPAADAYRGYAGALSMAIADTARTAELISYVVSIAGMLVAAVRELVRDLIAELVAILVERAWLWAAEAATVVGAPAAEAQIAALVAKWVGKVARVIAKLCRSLNNLKGLTDKLDEIWALLGKAWRRFREGDGPESDLPTARDPITGPDGKPPDTHGSPDGGTSPSAADPSKPGDGPDTKPSGTGWPPGDPSKPDPATKPSGTGWPSGDGAPSPGGTGSGNKPPGDRPPSRPSGDPNEERFGGLQDRAREIRDGFPRSPDTGQPTRAGRERTVATAEYDDGSGLPPRQYASSSGQAGRADGTEIPGGSRPSSNPAFDHSMPDGSGHRNYDAEGNILEDLHRRLPPDAGGTLRMWVDNPEGPCRACESVIDQFHRAHPNVRIEVRWPGGSQVWEAE